MKITIEKASGKAKCRHPDCPKNPLYIAASGRIIHQTPCVCIAFKHSSIYVAEYYCRDCIEKVYRDMKRILSPDLWAFQ